MTEVEIILLAKWFRETGNAVNVVKKLLNFLLNRLQTDLFIAETAGEQKETAETTDSADKIQKTSPNNRGSFVFA